MDDMPEATSRFKKGEEVRIWATDPDYVASIPKDKVKDAKWAYGRVAKVGISKAEGVLVLVEYPEYSKKLTDSDTLRKEWKPQAAVLPKDKFTKVKSKYYPGLDIYYHQRDGLVEGKIIQVDGDMVEIQYDMSGHRRVWKWEAINSEDVYLKTRPVLKRSQSVREHRRSRSFSENGEGDDAHRPRARSRSFSRSNSMSSIAGGAVKKAASMWRNSVLQARSSVLQEEWQQDELEDENEASQSHLQAQSDAPGTFAEVNTDWRGRQQVRPGALRTSTQDQDAI
jgi:hypothetical protein